MFSVEVTDASLVMDLFRFDLLVMMSSQLEDISGMMIDVGADVLLIDIAVREGVRQFLSGPAEL